MKLIRKVLTLKRFSLFRDQVSNFLKLRDETEVKLYNLLTSLQESEDSNPEFLEKVNLITN